MTLPVSELGNSLRKKMVNMNYTSPSSLYKGKWMRMKFREQLAPAHPVSLFRFVSAKAIIWVSSYCSVNHLHTMSPVFKLASVGVKGDVPSQSGVQGYSLFISSRTITGALKVSMTLMNSGGATGYITALSSIIYQAALNAPNIT